MNLRGILPEAVFTLILLFVVVVPVGATQFRYVFPPNLSISVTENTTVAGQSRKIIAVIQSRLGTLKNLEVFLDTSPDLTFSGNPIIIKEIPEMASETLGFNVSSTNLAPDEMGSWVSVRVSYLPDFERIQTIVADTKTYPIEEERQRLSAITNKNQTSKVPYTDSKRLFIEPRGGR
jgi:hypothetical protein